jgi:hypothetical protein
MRRRAFESVWMACVATVASCGSAGDDVHQASGAPPVVLDETLPPASVEVVGTTTPVAMASAQPIAACGDSPVTDAMFGEAQFAFVGTVSAIEPVVHPWTTDPENVDRPDVVTSTPWVTFEVESWYLRNWGSPLAVWMPDIAVTVGQRVAVGGNAYHTETDDFSGQSGEVNFCSPVADNETTPSAWDERLGNLVAPTLPPVVTAPLPATKIFGEHGDPCKPTVLTNGSDDAELIKAGAECMLGEFDAGRAVTWDVIISTVEGDPIVTRYAFDGTIVTITTDYSFDNFGSGGVAEQRCTGLAVTDIEWLPEGVECTTSNGEGFQPDSVRP